MSPAPLDAKVADGLLVDATVKLVELRKDHQWAKQTPPRCPPILWFGNALATKPLLLTVGANPSRQEYLADTSEVALAKFDRAGDHSTLAHLERSDSRFRLLTATESLADVVKDARIRSEILTGYNQYFARNPYRWFGLPPSPYNVEAFLRGMDASYYNMQPHTFQTLHIDLFPFATLDDFKTLERQVEAELFISGWAQHMIARLVHMLKPRAIIVFGRTNVKHFATYVDPAIGRLEWNGFQSGSYCIGETKTLGVKVVGLSTNLGNPTGFNKQSLGQFGAHVGRAVGLAVTRA